MTTSTVSAKTLNRAHSLIEANFRDQATLAVPITIANLKTDGTTSHSNKIALFTLDTVIGDRASDKLYDFAINCRYSKEPVTSLGLTVHYNGEITVTQSSDPIVNKPYTCDLGDNATMGNLAKQLLKQLTSNESTIDPYTGIFLDLLEISQPEAVSKNNIIELCRVKLDQSKMLQTMVKHGLKAPSGDPLNVFALVAQKQLSAAN